MANEYRLSTVAVEAYNIGAPAGRVTTVTAEAFHTGPANPTRVSTVTAEAFHDNFTVTLIRLSTVAIEVFQPFKQYILSSIDIEVFHSGPTSAACLSTAAIEVFVSVDYVYRLSTAVVEAFNTGDSIAVVSSVPLEVFYEPRALIQLSSVDIEAFLADNTDARVSTLAIEAFVSIISVGSDSGFTSIIW